MVINNINQIKKKKIVILKNEINKDLYKKIKLIFEKFYGIKILSDNYKNKNYILFFNPKNYLKSKLRRKFLLSISFDDVDGKIENLYQLDRLGLMDKNFNDQMFAKKFREFLLDKLKKKSKRVKKLNPLNFLLMKIGLRIAKVYFYKKFFFLTITNIGYFNEIIEGKEVASWSSYNCFFPKRKKFLKLYNNVYKNLSDKKSKKIYKKIIFDNPIKIWRMYKDNIFETNKYFDYIKLNKNSIILNCGTETGYEIPEYLTYNVNKIYNIDPSGTKHLHSYVKNYANVFKKKLTFIKKALYTTKGVFDYIDKMNIKVTTILELVKNLKLNRIDLIKTDIEGAEKNLIDDLGTIIKKFRPQLSIAIYHIDDEEDDRFSHLVSLPNKLMKICKNYNFHIRHYSFDRRETIMYCIPN